MRGRAGVGTAELAEGDSTAAPGSTRSLHQPAARVIPPRHHPGRRGPGTRPRCPQRTGRCRQVGIGFAVARPRAGPVRRRSALRDTVRGERRAGRGRGRARRVPPRARCRARPGTHWSARAHGAVPLDHRRPVDRGPSRGRRFRRTGQGSPTRLRIERRRGDEPPTARRAADRGRRDGVGRPAGRAQRDRPVAPASRRAAGGCRGRPGGGTDRLLRGLAHRLVHRVRPARAPAAPVDGEAGGGAAQPAPAIGRVVDGGHVGAGGVRPVLPGAAGGRRDGVPGDRGASRDVGADRARRRHAAARASPGPARPRRTRRRLDAGGGPGRAVPVPRPRAGARRGRGGHRTGS